MHTYFAISNNAWVFLEGLYLRNIIYRDVFTETHPITYYFLFGWGAILPAFICLFLCKHLYFSNRCWIETTTLSYWVIHVPVVFTVIMNFIFFVSILRVLFYKFKTSTTREAKKRKQMKLAKSTLFLIPMLGIPNITFIFLPRIVHMTLEIVRLYFEIIFSSFNSVIVAFLFCFMNDEVGGVIFHVFKF
ncbi:hypothetical protein HELRODRAFT_75027 [Helobdella robusta]|uniref:G-protein coupled receptors family 2 profile 2 domain-containing protein n=1 Tax=Helobdella robusta TaxID=6412 RepID=T1G1Z5_HELRO|nr:hypothetical protein HELRODRAFT_75027 [Helobdella robusta]ESO08642.1 hypothetical protein HELRODRAFT_75027 [Helobdella robusta]